MVCVKAELISTRLLSEQDKQDMLDGVLGVDSLVTGVRVWVDNGMPNYSDGSGDSYKPKLKLPMQRYRGVGKR